MRDEVIEIATSETVVIEEGDGQALIEMASAELEVVEVAKQGLPGPGPGDDNFIASVEEIATAEATEMRVDCDALVAALLFQH